VDYGENVGRHANSTFASSATLSMTHGAAYYGEVEDYVIGSDFGDAGPDGPWPTQLSSNGARHLSYHREWVGSFNGGVPTASREPDACKTSSSDQDGNDNIGSSCTSQNQDAFDNFSVTIIETGKIKVDFTVSAAVTGYGFQGGNGGVSTLKPDCSLAPIAATPATPAHQRVNMRYDAGNPQERLYVNIYADWDGNGTFETKLFSAPMDPEDWGKDGVYTLGEPFVDINKDGVWNPGESFTDATGLDGRTVSCIFDAPVPPPLNITQWVRLRLDYGENAGQFIRGSDAFEEAPPHVPAQSLGGAVWGEVEDTLLKSVDKRIDAPVISVAVPFRYILSVYANAAVTQTSEAMIQDQLPETLEFLGELTCSLPGQCEYTPSSHTVVWSGTIQPAQESVVEFVVRIPTCPPVPTEPPSIVNRMLYFDGLATGEVIATTTFKCPTE
jgi:hypothetical protein